MKVHEKLPYLVSRYKPDVAIVPECAAPDVIARKIAKDCPEFRMEWVGSKPNKGLAVFAFGEFDLGLADCFDERVEWVAPVVVRGPVEFNLLAVWALNHRASVQHPEHEFAPQPATALAVYGSWYAGKPLVMAGDFNANVIWDRPRVKTRNHSNTTTACEKAGLVSAYHAWTGEPQGGELTPTHYWRDRKIDGPSYHIDYIYLPEPWSPHVTSVEVGAFDAWVGNKMSDHVPMVVDVALP